VILFSCLIMLCHIYVDEINNNNNNNNNNNKHKHKYTQLLWFF